MLATHARVERLATENSARIRPPERCRSFARKTRRCFVVSATAPRALRLRWRMRLVRVLRAVFVALTGVRCTSRVDEEFLTEQARRAICASRIAAHRGTITDRTASRSP